MCSGLVLSSMYVSVGVSCSPIAGDVAAWCDWARGLGGGAKMRVPFAGDASCELRVVVSVDPPLFPFC